MYTGNDKELLNKGATLLYLKQQKTEVVQQNENS